MTFKPQPGDKLYSYMKILLEDDQTHLWQLTRIFDQIDRITEKPAEHQRLSPLIANFLSQWAIINDCKSILEWHRPAVEETEGVQEGAQQRLQKWIPLIASIVSGKSPDTNLAGKAFPVSRFMYPKGPRSADWARKCQSVDDAFNAFWKAANPWLVQTCGEELFTLGKRVVAPFAVEPTNWVELGKIILAPSFLTAYRVQRHRRRHRGAETRNRLRLCHSAGPHRAL